MTVPETADWAGCAEVLQLLLEVKSVDNKYSSNTTVRGLVEHGKAEQYSLSS